MIVSSVVIKYMLMKIELTEKEENEWLLFRSSIWRSN
jgi:hypothetical protein